jgi:hypothetical protein
VRTSALSWTEAAEWVKRLDSRMERVIWASIELRRNTSCLFSGIMIQLEGFGRWPKSGRAD